MTDFFTAPIDARGYADLRSANVCAYCGEDVGGSPCRGTRDMEERISGQHPSKECFAALMILGGGEYTENQRKAIAYRRLATRLGPS